MDYAYVLGIVITMLVCAVVLLVMQTASCAQDMSRVKRIAQLLGSNLAAVARA